MLELLSDVRGVEIQFITPNGIVHAVNDVSFDLQEEETFYYVVG